MRYSVYIVLAATVTSSVPPTTTQSSTASIKSIGSTSAKTAGIVAQSIVTIIILTQV